MDFQEYEVITDYKPVTDIEKDITSIDNTYLEDLKSWGEPPSWTVPIKEELLPITFDYLRFKSNIQTLIWDQEGILNLELSKYYKLRPDYISKSVTSPSTLNGTNEIFYRNNGTSTSNSSSNHTNEIFNETYESSNGGIYKNISTEDINEIKDFLLKGRYIKLKEEDKVCKGFRPIEAGILCGGKYKTVFSSNLNSSLDSLDSLDSLNSRSLSDASKPFFSGTDIGNKTIENRRDLDDRREQELEEDDRRDPDDRKEHRQEQEQEDRRDLDVIREDRKEQEQENRKDNNKKIEEIKNGRKRHYIEFIIIISAPNRRGDPGRLYILNF
jgi:hypothetical protein